jgi:hypothetical protein
MFLHDGFSATGVGGAGAIRLAEAHIGGQLVCSGATLTNESGPALTADGLHVDAEMFLRQLSATGISEDPAVRLPGARIGGPLDWSGASVSHKRGPSWCWRLSGLTYIGVPLHYRGTTPLSGYHSTRSIVLPRTWWRNGGWSCFARRRRRMRRSRISSWRLHTERQVTTARSGGS